MSRTTVYITLQGTVIRETEKAVLFVIDSVSGTPLDAQITKWIPLSQCERRFTSKNEGEDTVTISEWMYEKLSLEIE